MAASQATATFANAAEWAKWLSREESSSKADEALDEALCHGWINGQGRKGDETTIIQWFTPRRPNSLWSKRNVEHIARLERAGRMKSRGSLEVEKAKENGRWATAYSQANNEAPPDLLAAIAVVPEAQAQWDILTKQNRFAICFRLASLKTAAGRQKRLETSVEMLSRGETYHPQKQSREALQPSRSNATAKRKSPESKAPTSAEDSSYRRSKRLQTRSAPT